MATKKQKRLAGELKAAQQREETRLSGLQAQKEDQERREREFQMAAVARSGKKVHFVDPGPKSKVAKEKEARVKKRLEEMALTELNTRDPEDFETAQKFVQSVMIGGLLQDAITGPVRKL